MDLHESEARRQHIAPWLMQPQAIRTILFDVGFTLVTPNPSVASVVQRVCAREGVAVSEDDLLAHLPAAEERFAHGQHHLRQTWADNDAIVATWDDYFTTLLRPLLRGTKLRRCVAAVLAEFDRHTAWQLFDDVLPALDRLQGRYVLGGVSDWGIALGAILRDLGLTRYFQVLVVSAAIRRSKPDPHLFQTALERADAVGDYTLYIGDSYVQDVLGARAAGIHPILIDRQQTVDPTAIDCPVIASLAEVPLLLGIV
jgi:putative hydrolase of the HAD superfamily